MKSIAAAVLVVLLSFNCIAAEKNEKPKPAQTTDELKQQIEKILKDSHTPGVSVAIVHKDGPEWVAGVGTADVASGRAATAETLFRIGSTSKAFAALSILMLTDQGKLTLDDPVHKLVPDVWYANRWEDSDPVRVVHLLEHTTGWDDTHLREYAKQAPDTMSLREALDYDHHSRTSRWRPGTRMSYCNSGPPVAAAIVEKLSGQRFEDYVQQNLFSPIGMKTATYFEPPSGSATTLYHEDGKTPYHYWHILVRPAGSINASANDMAAYLQFYLHRGAVNGRQLVPASDIDRMENPASTWAAKDGMKTGYGLGNYWSIHEGFVYHGHDGGVDGGLTEMAYMPDAGVGYFFSINTGNGDAFDKIGKTIRAFITDKLQKPQLPDAASLPADYAEYAGWYEPDSPRNEIARFVERLSGLTRIQFKDGRLSSSGLGEWNEIYLPLTGTQFRHLPKGDAPDPVASLMLLTPNQEGRFVQSGFGDVMKRIPTAFALFEIALTVFVVLSMFSILIYAPFWIVGGFFKRRRRPAERSIRLWPLLAVLSLLAFVGIIIVCSDELIDRMGNQTVWSEALYLTTIFYGFAVLFSFAAWWRAPRNEIRPRVLVFSRVVILGLLVAALYFGYWGVIGLRTWA